MFLLTLAAMAVNWMATTILVEAYVLQPVRDWVGGTTYRETLMGQKVSWRR